MNVALESEPLPRSVRRASFLCLLLSALVGFGAASEAMGLARFSELKDELPRQALQFSQRDVTEKMVQAQLSALESMRGGRMFTLACLSLACAFASVSAARMLRPGGLPRENMRRILSFSALMAAALRTIDGAQFTVVAKKMGTAMAANIQHLPELADPKMLANAERALPMMTGAGAVLFTALIAGTFAVLSQYFRSPKVKDIVAVCDRGVGS